MGGSYGQRAMISRNFAMIRFRRGKGRGAKDSPRDFVGTLDFGLWTLKWERMSDTLVINEIYLSLQGESTFAGLPCVFVRLTACDLRCSYCDTAYAFTEGKRKTVTEARAEVNRLAQPFRSEHLIRDSGARLPLVELTGCEPLLQKNSLALMKQLCDDGFTVLLETSGAHDIAAVDPRVRRIMDLKCPSSGEASRNRGEK